MRSEIAELVHECKLNGPPNPSDLDKLRQSLPSGFPSDYMEFLAQFNGMEGFMRDGSYLMLWRAEKICEFNDGYCVSELAPGIVLIGSDGGGNAFGVDTRVEPYRFIAVPFVDLDLEYLQVLGSSLEEFFTVLAYGDPS